MADHSIDFIFRGHNRDLSRAAKESAGDVRRVAGAAVGSSAEFAAAEEAKAASAVAASRTIRTASTQQAAAVERSAAADVTAARSMQASEAIKQRSVRTTAALTKETTLATRATGGLKSGMGGLGVTVGAIGIGTAVVAIKSFVKAAQESEVSTRRMQGALKTAGTSYSAHKQEIDGVIASTSRLAAIDDEDLQDAFSRLVRGNQDVGKSLKETALAADISRGAGMSLAAATKLIQMTESGRLMGLGKLGIQVAKTTEAQAAARAEIARYTASHGTLDAKEKEHIKTLLATAKAEDKRKDSVNAIAELQRRFGGEAERYGKSAAAAGDRASVAWENLREKLGGKLLPTIRTVGNAFATYLDRLANSRQIHDAVAAAVGKIREIIDALKPALSAVGTYFVEIGKAWLKIGRALVDAFKDVFAVFGGKDAKKGQEGMAGLREAAKQIAVVLNKVVIPAVQIFAKILATQIKIVAKIVAVEVAIIVAVVRRIITVVNAVRDAVPGIAGAFTSTWGRVRKTVEGIVTYLSGLPGTVLAKGKAIGKAIVDGVTSGATGLVLGIQAKFQALWGWIKGAASSAATYAAQIGQAIINGILDKLTSLPGLLKDKVEGALREGLGKLNPFSPVSAGGAKFIGQPLIDGAISAIEAGATSIQKALEGVIGFGVRGANKTLRQQIAAAVASARSNLLAASITTSGTGGGAGAGAGGLSSAQARAMAATFNRILAERGSPMRGLGASFVTSGVRSGIDPRALFSIAGHESQYGTKGFATTGSKNAFGWGGKTFKSWEEGVETVARGLASGYLAAGLDTIAKIQGRYAPVGAGNDPKSLNQFWQTGVGAIFASLGGNPKGSVRTGLAPKTGGGGGTGAASSSALMLPTSFSGDHPTGGLESYIPEGYSLDIFGTAGREVGAPEAGTIGRIQGQHAGDPDFRGFGLYLFADSGYTYFIKHLATVAVKSGDRVAKGSLLGTIAAGTSGGDHVHIGKTPGKTDIPSGHGSSVDPGQYYVPGKGTGGGGGPVGAGGGTGASAKIAQELIVKIQQTAGILGRIAGGTVAGITKGGQHQFTGGVAELAAELAAVRNPAELAAILRRARTLGSEFGTARGATALVRRIEMPRRDFGLSRTGPRSEREREGAVTLPSGMSQLLPRFRNDVRMGVEAIREMLRTAVTPRDYANIREATARVNKLWADGLRLGPAITATRTSLDKIRERFAALPPSIQKGLAPELAKVNKALGAAVTPEALARVREMMERLSSRITAGGQRAAAAMKTASNAIGAGLDLKAARDKAAVEAALALDRAQATTGVGVSKIFAQIVRLPADARARLLPRLNRITQDLGDIVTPAALARIRVRMASLSASVATAVAALRTKVSAAQTGVSEAAQKVLARALRAFDAQTQKLVRDARVSVMGFDFGDGTETPSEIALRNLRDSRAAASLARQRAEIQARMAAIQAQLGGPDDPENPIDRAALQRELVDLQRDLDEMILDEQERGLERQAELERKAGEEALAARRMEIEEQREAMRDQFEARFEEMTKGWAREHTSAEVAMQQLIELLAAYGLGNPEDADWSIAALGGVVGEAFRLAFLAEMETLYDETEAYVKAMILLLASIGTGAPPEKPIGKRRMGLADGGPVVAGATSRAGSFLLARSMGGTAGSDQHWRKLGADEIVLNRPQQNRIASDLSSRGPGGISLDLTLVNPTFLTGDRFAARQLARLVQDALREIPEIRVA